MTEKVITTLHSEVDTSKEIYPNILEENLPQAYKDSINAKISNNTLSITEEKESRENLIHLEETGEIVVGTSDYNLELVGVTTYARGTFVGFNIKTNKVDNTNGNAIVRFKEVENKVVLGGSTIPTTIMGSGDRPTYSKDGSDFEGKEIALLDDVKSAIVGKTILYSHTLEFDNIDKKLVIVNNIKDDLTNNILLNIMLKIKNLNIYLQGYIDGEVFNIPLIYNYDVSSMSFLYTYIDATKSMGFNSFSIDINNIVSSDTIEEIIY